MKTMGPISECQKPLQKRSGLLGGYGVKGQSKGQLSEAFVTFIRVPLGNGYNKFASMQEISLSLRSSTKC